MRTTPCVALATSLLLVLSACADEDGGPPSPSPAPSASSSTSASPSASATSQTTSTPPVQPTSTSAVSVYFLTGEKVQPVRRTATGVGVAAEAVRALLAGPSAAERAAGLTSAVPTGTRLRGITIRDRVATVDLTGRFDDGGGSLSMTARLAQLVFTLTRFPTVDRMSLRLDGRPVAVLGGEGVDVREPVGRDDVEGLSPAVLVETPRWAETVDAPLRVTGTANVFEAVFFLELVDARGRQLVEQRVMASSGSGTRGTFDVTLRPAGTGEVRLNAFIYSAEDGSRRDVASVPLALSAP